jgi:non-specific serine/threonine protein kinase
LTFFEGAADMALPLLLKYVYNSGTDEVIRRGKRIFMTGGAELVQVDPLLKTAIFQVKSDTHPNSYRVTISKYNEPNGVSVRCQCPYNLGEICRHEAAALFQLQDLIDKNFVNEAEMQYDQRHTVIKMKNIDLKTLRLLSSQETFLEAENIARHHQAAILKAADEWVDASLVYEGQTYALTIKRNEDRNFDTRCDCDDVHHPLCKHKTALFLQLLNAYGPYYFDTLRNWDKEKNKLLTQYGYSLSDDLEGKFAFSYVNGKPFLRVLDPSIRKITLPQESATESRLRTSAGLVATEQDVPPTVEADTEESKSVRRTGVVFTNRKKEFPYLEIELVQGEVNEQQDAFVSFIRKLELTRYLDYYSFSYADRELISHVRKLQPQELHKYLSRNSPFEALWENIYLEDGENLPEDTRKLILEYMYSRLKRLAPLLAKRNLNFWLPGSQNLRSNHLEAIQLKEIRIKPELQVRLNDTEAQISCFIPIEGEKIPVGQNRSGSPLIFIHNKDLYFYGHKEDPGVVDRYSPSPLKIPLADWPRFLQEELLPLSGHYKVHFDKDLISDIWDEKPQYCIRVKELGDLFIIQPVFFYRNHQVEWEESREITVEENGRILRLHRDKEAEEDFIQKIQDLHPSFKNINNHNYFYLHTKEAIKRGWFLQFSDALKTLEVPVTGFESLKHFRFNRNKPQTQLSFSSGIDWFDARVEVSYGDQSVNIRDIKKALADKQNYVALPDGTLGLLPEQWMAKYGLFFRMGEESEQGLRISKYNFSVIDELYEHIDNDEILSELEDKKQKLLQLEQLPPVALPTNITAILRSYQESGFQWLCYLNEVKWGGILGDDMGLGKTLQALSFLQHYKNQYGHCFSMVVCPTTLIYNWENEIRKFTPDLSYVIHHGPARSRNTEELKDHNIILTTYGTLRSDIQLFIQLSFDYVVLDESQAIKNPQSKITKTTQLLNTYNKLCLSGTPMQNNTLDLYAQMNFLNPGMLGSLDFFRNEFATPIDKFGDQERKEHLRKLIYPFVLRRTKEQVAKDLPEKSEMVLFCEMEPEQRHIYESFRNMYRSKILGTIDEQGIGRSQLTILQGLMKLRQICDSPAILKEEEPYPNQSVKLHELTRELHENTGEHKVLVFSQFLGMLSLIKERLERLHIPFEYFDGSTSAADRETAIQNFQENEHCRVFLISLKAGGVGLNLTAADYVYIVDPWWNPAVEQQAIDRTHRIGQTKNIFAYRMICKNTVEEKILQLQEKKKSLVKDIISDESGFIKKLTREDVLYLFS